MITFGVKAVHPPGKAEHLHKNQIDTKGNTTFRIEHLSKPLGNQTHQKTIETLGILGIQKRTKPKK